MLRGVLVGSLVLLGVAASPAAAATTTPAGRSASSAQTDLIAAVNAYRAANGRQPVAPNAALGAAAAWMAGDMAAKSYIAHTSSDGRTPVQRMTAFGYPAASRYTGEDLAAGYAAAADVIAGWQASAAHNAVLLNPNFDAIGVGLAYQPASAYKWFWAADFGGAGGIVRVVIAPAPPPPQRAAPPARAAAPEEVPAEADTAPADEVAATPEAAPSFEDRLWWRRIDHLFAVLARMGWL